MTYRVLDLYCCQGGATRGYQLAGFTVHGVDNTPQPRYCGEKFHLADAIGFVRRNKSLIRNYFHAVHASPPCQADCTLTAGTNAGKGNHISLLAPTREILEDLGLPYVIEQPVGKAVMRQDLLLCGLHFDLQVFRHRQFELGGWTTPNLEHPPGMHKGHRVAGWRHGVRYDGDMYAVYGEGGGKGSIAEWQKAMGIDWMHDRRGLAEAIPPAYTQWIGTRLRNYLEGINA